MLRFQKRKDSITSGLKILVGLSPKRLFLVSSAFVFIKEISIRVTALNKTLGKNIIIDGNELSGQEKYQRNKER